MRPNHRTHQLPKLFSPPQRTRTLALGETTGQSKPYDPKTDTPT